MHGPRNEARRALGAAPLVEAPVEAQSRFSGSRPSLSARLCWLTALRLLSHVASDTVMTLTAIHAITIPRFCPMSFLVLKMMVRTTRERL